MKTPAAGKGDKPRPYSPAKYGRNFQEIRKACGCALGTKCDHKPVDKSNRPA